MRGVYEGKEIDEWMSVPPDGSREHAKYVILGEAPATEEVRQGRGFCGPSGKLLWPVLRRLRGIERDECWVTNLCKHPLDNSKPGDEKMTDAEFVQCTLDLAAELHEVKAEYVLAVGALAATAMLGDLYIRMEVNNGMTYRVGRRLVTPCWHPAAALHGDVGKDPLAWMGDAIAHFGRIDVERSPQYVNVPPWEIYQGTSLPVSVLAIDTEGTPDDPHCLTFATANKRAYVEREKVPVFWRAVEADTILIYHNAPWDWAVMEAMGIEHPERHPFRDTMELAYLKQTEPQGLKDLSRRHFGIDMKSWEDVVMPHYNAFVTEVAQGQVDALTTTITHSEKTGKLLKKPKVIVDPEVKPLKRALNNPELLRKRMPWLPPPSLRYVPDAEVAEYATLDPFMTLKLWEKLL